VHGLSTALCTECCLRSAHHSASASTVCGVGTCELLEPTLMPSGRRLSLSSQVYLPSVPLGMPTSFAKRRNVISSSCRNTPVLFSQSATAFVRRWRGSPIDQLTRDALAFGAAAAAAAAAGFAAAGDAEEAGAVVGGGVGAISIAGAAGAGAVGVACCARTGAGATVPAGPCAPLLAACRASSAASQRAGLASAAA
jgi:hypothetical protein